MRRFAGALSPLVVLFAALALAGCGGTPGGDDEEQAAQTQPGTTFVEPKEPVTLVVLDGETDSPARVETYNRLDREFEKLHPKVTIERTSKSLNDLITTLKLELSSDSAPDVAETNQGYTIMGELVKAGLLLPLDEYAKQYGWLDRQPESLLDMARFSPDGREISTGNLYGISVTGDIVGVYYDRKRLSKLGLEVPETLGEFEEALAAAKQAGEVPIVFGNLDKWPGIHELQTVQNATLDKEYLRDFIFGRAEVSFETTENVEAGSTIQEWVDKGYFNEGFNGVGYDVAWKRFTKGEGLFMITGTWLNGSLVQEMGDNLGFFLMPRETAGEPPIATSSGGLPWGIPKKSRYPDLAAAYIDFITGEEAAVEFAKSGDVPAMIQADTSGVVEPGSSLESGIEAWRTLAENDTFIPYLDWATPTFYDTVTAAIQELLGGKASPAEFNAKLQNDYAKFIESR